MCVHMNIYKFIKIYSGTPTKPTVRVYNKQLIRLKINNYKLRMVCLPSNKNFIYSYKWERKDKKLPLNAQYTSSGGLYITDLKPEDSGEYRCIISNSTGQIASDYSLVTVTGLIYHTVKHGDMYNCVCIILFMLNYWRKKSLKSVKNNCMYSYSYEEVIESRIHAILVLDSSIIKIFLNKKLMKA